MPTASRDDQKKRADALSAYVKLMRAAEAVTATTHRGLAKAGLTLSQFGVMEALLHLGPLCQRDLGKKILKSSGNITTVIDNLERRGLVERRRDSEDRRFITVHLTEQGHRIIEEVFPQVEGQIVGAFDVLTPEEERELAHLCRKLGLGQQR